MFEMLADIPRRVTDQDALTAAEIGSELGLQYDSTRRLCAAKLKSGEWERVGKLVDGRYTVAYRVKQPLKKRR